MYVHTLTIQTRAIAAVALEVKKIKKLRGGSANWTIGQTRPIILQGSVTTRLRRNKKIADLLPDLAVKELSKSVVIFCTQDYSSTYLTHVANCTGSGPPSTSAQNQLFAYSQSQLSAVSTNSR